VRHVDLVWGIGSHCTSGHGLQGIAVSAGRGCLCCSCHDVRELTVGGGYVVIAVFFPPRWKS